MLTVCHVLICHLNIFSSEMPINIFGPFSNWIACFSLMGSESSLYCPDPGRLVAVWFAHVPPSRVRFMLWFPLRLGVHLLQPLVEQAVLPPLHLVCTSANNLLGLCINLSQTRARNKEVG